MYAGLWRILPGPWIVKLLIVLALAAGALYALFYYVFPLVSPYITPGEIDIE